MVVVREVFRSSGDVRTEQVHRELVGKMCRIDDWDCNRAILVDEGTHTDLLHTTLSVDAHRAGTCKAEVRSKGPEPGGDEVVVVLQANQRVVAGRILGAPPVSVAGSVATHEGVVHIQRPLETFPAHELINARDELE